MRSILIAAVVALCAAVAVPAVAHKGGKHKRHKPEVIALPDGFRPEGITTGKRQTFYVGSRATGAIYKGSLRSGRGRILVEGGDGRQATGIKLDRRKRLFVSGAASKEILVYDSRTGKELRRYDAEDSGFINDNVVTRRGVYFTDSQVPQLYFLPFGRRGALPRELQRIPITGDFVYGPGFNANGIEKARGGRTLILISSNTGNLYTADARTGATKQIAVSGGDGELVNGDGILRKGRKLYVVENQDDPNGAAPGVGVVSVLKLGRGLTTATIKRTITDPRFDVPTTIARSHGRKYVVNAKFASPSPETDSYEVVKVPRR